MQSIKCRQCNLINFAAAEVCQRCRDELRNTVQPAKKGLFTNGFAVVILIISAFFLYIGLTSPSAKPVMLIFWSVIFVLCGYKLFFRSKSF